MKIHNLDNSPGCVCDKPYWHQMKKIKWTFREIWKSDSWNRWLDSGILTPRRFASPPSPRGRSRNRCVEREKEGFHSYGTSVFLDMIVFSFSTILSFHPLSTRDNVCNPSPSFRTIRCLAESFAFAESFALLPPSPPRQRGEGGVGGGEGPIQYAPPYGNGMHGYRMNPKEKIDYIPRRFLSSALITFPEAFSGNSETK